MADWDIPDTAIDGVDPSCAGTLLKGLENHVLDLVVGAGLPLFGALSLGFKV
jgi:hypothetical protein